jgi:hypothetical protein
MSRSAGTRTLAVLGGVAAGVARVVTQGKLLGEK